jgi:predicted dehydrogenase
LRIGFVGAGDLAYRVILPAFQYAPVDLVALATPDKVRGLAVARQFGARRLYPSHKAMLTKEEMDAVFVATGLDNDGQLLSTEVCEDALKAGFHVWVAPPPCANRDEINRFTNACIKSHKFVACGFKRMATPVYQAVARIMADRAFGDIQSFYLRYPLFLPPKPAKGEKPAPGLDPFIEFVHPYSLLTFLFGECREMRVFRGTSGAGFINLAYPKGVVGTLHLSGGQAATSPLERLEVVGTGANVVVDNGVTLTYYRPGGERGQSDMAQSEDYIGAHEHGPVVWEPEFSLGSLYSKQVFIEGYVGIIRAFCEKLLAGEPPKLGNLVDMLHIMSIYDVIRAGDELKPASGF